MENRVDEILSNLVEVSLFDDEDFLKVVETLSRIGVSSNTEKRLYPSVHILHKRGRYYLCHFKDLFMLDGGSANISEQDRERYYTICNLLSEWGLVKLENPTTLQDKPMNIKLVKIVSHSDKHNWTIINKYTIGKKAKSGNI